MKKHGMTKWDAGQVIIKASDTLFDCALELRETHEDFADMLYHMACQIGTEFNKYGSHDFGLRALDECTCSECKPDSHILNRSS